MKEKAVIEGWESKPKFAHQLVVLSFHLTLCQIDSLFKPNLIDFRLLNHSLIFLMNKNSLSLFKTMIKFKAVSFDFSTIHNIYFFDSLKSNKYYLRELQTFLKRCQSLILIS